MYKKIPPATETLRDSNFPVMGMLTSSHSSWDFSESPCPSLPKTKHDGTCATECTNSWDSENGFFNFPSISGWPASIFMLNVSFRVWRWNQLPETIGSWKEAPRLALSAFSLNGSQQPGRRNIPSCWVLTKTESGAIMECRHFDTINTNCIEEEKRNRDGYLTMKSKKLCLISWMKYLSAKDTFTHVHLPLDDESTIYITMYAGLHTHDWRVSKQLINYNGYVFRQKQKQRLLIQIIMEYYGKIICKACMYMNTCGKQVDELLTTSRQEEKE